MLNPLAANLEALARRFGRAPAVSATLADAPAVEPDSESAAIARATEWLTTALPDPMPALICGVGLGRGYALDALESRSPSTRVVVVEPDEATARALLSRRSWVRAIEAGRLAVLAGPDYSGAAAVARDMPGLAHAPVITDPVIAREQPSHVAAAREALTRVVFQSDANDTARRTFAPRYVMHTLANVPRLAREGDAAHLSGAFTGVPAIIAAAGPSLDRNLHDIAPVLDRALLIACDTATWPLVSAGAMPHVIVAVDASEANARHLSSLPPGRSVLVSEASVHPSALGPFDGRTFFFRVADHEPWPWLRSLGLDRGRLDAWGSVATTAFALALEMGCNPIIFVGADFAFTGNRPYCRGTSFETIWASWVAGGQTYDGVWQYLVDKWPAHTAKDIHGQPVRTAPHLVAFRDWVAERAAARADRIVVNATGAGLLAGPAIRQQTASAALAGTMRLEAEHIRRHLRSLHRGSQSDLMLALASITSLLTGHETATIDRWIGFTNGALSRDALRVALTSPEQRAWALGCDAGVVLARTAS